MPQPKPLPAEQAISPRGVLLFVCSCSPPLLALLIALPDVQVVRRAELAVADERDVRLDGVVSRPERMQEHNVPAHRASNRTGPHAEDRSVEAPLLRDHVEEAGVDRLQPHVPSVDRELIYRGVEPGLEGRLQLLVGVAVDALRHEPARV